MATATAKQNGTAKKTIATAKTNGKAVAPKEQPTQVKTLTQEAVGKVQSVSLDARLQSFQKLQGLNNQRERLANTLAKLSKFKYSNGDSYVFLLRDENGEEFKTTNNNLITYITDLLQNTLQVKKEEIESDILKFEF